MKQERPNTQIVLIDIKYHDSLNAFECHYGENVSYQEMEQRSYIEFKELIFDSICRDIKFRKHVRIGQVLTIKADMLKHEIEEFAKLLQDDKVQLIHQWIVSNVSLITDSKNFEAKQKKQKNLDNDEENDQNDDLISDDIIESSEDIF